VHQPASTFFAADGLPGSVGNEIVGAGLFTLYPNNLGKTVVPPATMADALTGKTTAGDPACFDKLRHQGKINIGFCDGHVECLSMANSDQQIISGDLQKVYIMPP